MVQILLKDSINSNIEEQVAMFLHVLGHNLRFRVVKLTFRRTHLAGRNTV